MYFPSGVSKAFTHSRIILRTRLSNVYNTSKANRFTRELDVTDSKHFPISVKKVALRNIGSKLDYIGKLVLDKTLKTLTNIMAVEFRRRLVPNVRILSRLHQYQPNNFIRVPKATIVTRHQPIADVKLFLPIKSTEAKNIQTKYDRARRLLVNNVLKGVTNSLAADLRRHSVKQLFNGNPSPFFALVGISLASGTGIVTKQDEFEGICWEIRESVCRMRKNLFETETCEFEEKFDLNSLEFGSVIAKGSSAVVYEAREKSKNGQSSTTDEYPLAVKMMFNYDAESNAISILRSMYREMVPLQNVPVETNASNFWENEMAKRIQRLPPHVNVVKMYRSFTDYVPDLPDSRNLYPDALPMRLNPDGYGRNMSLFLVMKRYQTNLKQYLTENRPNFKDCILLFTQLLEAVTHFNKYEIAHRDLKADNILLDTSNGNETCPLLVVTDFGCCLADKQYGLTVPFKTPDIDRGGNAALMAPEVITAQPGMFSSIDYSKADVWTAGTLAYEIFTQQNPFYQYKNQADKKALQNTTYTEDMLPELPADVPSLIRRVVQALLVRNPAKRLDAETAATICQVHLWAPSQWLSSDKSPSNNDILQWLLSLTTKVLYEGPLFYQKSEIKRTSTTEYQLTATFLQRAKLSIIRKALYWIHNGNGLKFTIVPGCINRKIVEEFQTRIADEIYEAEGKLKIDYLSRRKIGMRFTKRQLNVAMHFCIK